jgi:hypothetical protein
MIQLYIVLQFGFIEFVSIFLNLPMEHTIYYIVMIVRIWRQAMKYLYVSSHISCHLI